ncbi:GlsB/YeaQ/YmgE family stress response membrane protein [Arthrobacter deserti]|uniref:GlsB/YeaQ/YmgE family stress response membrane protein n=1 Tax=Arthrobacter deserti TaxID=1742687 RepID=A0ABX1JPQ6_9MICC|nr:GlsB/YeaQ/YmgE family stress response membrane protein [Arthrobacter deserti]
MGFIAFLILGLIAGAIAKLILPGDQAGGWLATLVLGVIGALLGGWIGSALFGVGLEEIWSIQTWIVAIVGSTIVLLIWGFITRGRSRRTV